LQQALAHYQIVGVKTNLDLLSNIVKNSDFVTEKFDTDFIKQHEIELLHTTEITTETFALATLCVLLIQQNKSKQSNDPWQMADSWKLNLPAQQNIEFLYKDQKI
jgi:3-methylcrotonyl-CoA carboxylase alpha subunit